MSETLVGWIYCLLAIANFALSEMEFLRKVWASFAKHSPKLAKGLANWGWAGMLGLALGMESAHEYGAALFLVIVGALAVAATCVYWAGHEGSHLLTWVIRISGLLFAVVLAVVGTIGVIGEKGQQSWSRLPDDWRVVFHQVNVGSKDAPIAQINTPSTPAEPTSTRPPVDIGTSTERSIKEIERMLIEMRQTQGGKEGYGLVVKVSANILNMHRNSPLMYVGSVPPPTLQLPASYRIYVKPVNLSVFVGILNQESVPTVVQSVKGELKVGKKWLRLKYVNTVFDHVYGRQSADRWGICDNNDFLDRKLHQKVLNVGDPAVGWVLFSYPKELEEIPQSAFKTLSLRITIIDGGGHEFTQSNATNALPDDVQGMRGAWAFPTSFVTVSPDHVEVEE